MEKTTEKVIGDTALTAADKAEQKFLQSTFKNQLTQDGLAELRARFPADVIRDMTDEETFKSARKDRTECNKLVEAISRRRIDFTNNLKAYSDSLEAEVKEIFDVVVVPFEIEDKRRKDEARRIKQEHEDMLAGQRKQLDDIKAWIETAKETDSIEEISSLIDAVSNIEAEQFHKDIIHEVLETLKNVKDSLGEILTQKIEKQRLEKEAEAAIKAKQEAEAAILEAKRISDAAAAEAKLEADKAAEEAKRVADEALFLEKKKAEIAERLQKLSMIPLDLMSVSAGSAMIKAKIASLEKFVIPESDFLERYNEAVATKSSVIANLTKMLAQTEITERYAAEQFEKEQAAIAEQAALNQAAEQVQEPVILRDAEYQQTYEEQIIDGHIHQEHIPEAKAPSPVSVLASMGRASDLLPLTLEQDIINWGNSWAVPQDVYGDLIVILNRHNVQL
ncbi:MAG: hypothetical protein ACRCUH_15320 [Shewanella sp.]